MGFCGQAAALKPKTTIHNATAYKDILDNYMLPTLWQQFVKCPFLFQHDCAAVHKVGKGRVQLHISAPGFAMGYPACSYRCDSQALTYFCILPGLLFFSFALEL